MEKKDIIITGLIFLIVVLISFIIFQNISKKNNLIEENMEPLFSQEEVKSYEKALLDLDVNLCKKIEFDDIKQDCINKINLMLAKLNDDINYCNNINLDGIKQNCKSEISKNLALKNKDKTYCENLNNEFEIENCKLQIDLMKVKVSEDISICNQYSLNSQMFCMQSILQKLNSEFDYNSCSLLNEELIPYCEQSIQNLPNNNLNCNMIENKQEKERCELGELFNSNKILDLEICNNLNSSEEINSCTDFLKQRNAKLSLDVNYCNSIENIQEKNNCLLEFSTKLSIENEDVSYCDNLNSFEKDFCIDNFVFEMIQKTGQKSYCDLLKNEDMKNNCQEISQNINANLNYNKNYCIESLENWNERIDCLNKIETFNLYT